MKLAITCEHGGSFIPEKYLTYFKNKQKELASHKGYDLGALSIYNRLLVQADFYTHSETSRLLIELNRSLHHPNLFSNASLKLTVKEKEKLIDNYYLEYRNRVEAVFKSWNEENEPIIHLSIHSFTPILNNEIRNADIGLLYDSTKKEEQKFCKTLKIELKKISPELKVRMNYPYLGKADGFTTYLRKKIPSNYIGVEIEINQKFSFNNHMDLKIIEAMELAIKNTIKTYNV